MNSMLSSDELLIFLIESKFSSNMTAERCRWLLLCNPMLADLISDKIGDEWPVHLDQLTQIKQYAEDPKFQR